MRADVLAKLGINRMEELVILDSLCAADRRCEAHGFCSQLLVELGFCFGVCCFFFMFFFLFSLAILFFDKISLAILYKTKIVSSIYLFIYEINRYVYLA